MLHLSEAGLKKQSVIENPTLPPKGSIGHWRRLRQTGIFQYKSRDC
jgi:hypothetical protein